MTSVIYVQKIDRREIGVEPISLTWQRLENDQSNVQIFIDIDRQSSVSIKRVASRKGVRFRFPTGVNFQSGCETVKKTSIKIDPWYSVCNRNSYHALSAYLVNNISFSESRYREGKKYNTRYELVLRLFLLSLRISTTVGRVCGETEQMTSCNVRIFLFLLSCCFRKRKILYTFILEIIREWEKKKWEGEIRKRREDLDTLLWTRNEILGQSSFTLI